MDSPPLSSPGISILLPPRVFLACILVGITADILLPTPLASLVAIPLWIHLLTGLVVIGGGFAFMMWGHNRFTSVGTPVKTREAATTLVTEGAYRHSRNPMYVGFVTILLGLGIAANSLPLMVSAVVMFLFLDRYVIPREERYLRYRFDEAYIDYCRSVRRWL